MFGENWGVRAWDDVSESYHWLRLKSRPLAATMTSHVPAWGQSQHSRRIIKGRPFAVRSECKPELYREEHPL